MIKSLCLIFMYSTVSYAQVSDPLAILPMVDKYLNGPEYEVAFQAGDTIQYIFFDGSDKSVTRAKIEAVNNALKINSYDQRGKLYHVSEIKPSDWQWANKNLVRLKINSVQSFGFQIQILSWDSAPCPDLSDIFKPQECMKLIFNGKNQIGFTTRYEIIVAPTNVAIAQILYYRQIDDGIFRRTQEYLLQSIAR